MLQFLIPTISLLPSLSLSNFTLTNWPPLQHNPYHVLHHFLYFVLPHSITIHHKYCIYQTIWKPYADHNTVWDKRTTRQKSESLRAASLSMLNNMVEKQLYLKCKICWILYKTIGTSSFSQPDLCIQSTSQSPSKIRSSTLVNFHLPIKPLIVHKIIFTIPTNNTFLYTSAISHLPFFVYNHPNNLHQKYFPTSTI